MPRIPQGQFDTNPSTRVQAHQVQLATGAADNFTKAAANLTGAMALLQDQGERTEAYTAANKVKQDYLAKKVTYMEALETSNGSGMASYFDPNDKEQDLSKRKRIQRPIAEMKAELIQFYDEAKKETGKLTRGDIAHELMREYVGDDIIRLEMQTNKHLNRVREKEIDQNVGENMELILSTTMEQVSDPNATPEVIDLALGHMNNKLQREFAQAAPVLGAKAMEDKQKQLDRVLGNVAAKTIENGGVSNSTVAASEGFIKRIKDPLVQQMSLSRLEKVKKHTAEVKFVTNLNTATDMTQTVLTASSISDVDYLKGIQTVKSVMNTYSDEKYVPGGDAKKKQAAAELWSALMAKRTLQQKMTEDLKFLADGSLDPAESVGEEGDWNALYRGNRRPSGDSSKGIRSSESALEFIKKKEGFRSEAYDDGVGNKTIGYGRTTGDMANTTPEKEEQFLRARVQEAEKELSSVITRKDLTQSQMDVLVDMHYNLGLKNMQSFVKVVNEGTDEQILNAMAKYTKATKRDKDGNPILGPDGQPEVLELDGLVERTARRMEMWRNPAGGNSTAVASLMGPKTQKLHDDIDKELEASGLKNMMGGD
jgi:lysozyme